ncbi:hypothetical protein ACFL6D_03715, partial [Spirochaetota bacterium]
MKSKLLIMIMLLLCIIHAKRIFIPDWQLTGDDTNAAGIAEAYALAAAVGDEIIYTSNIIDFHSGRLLVSKKFKIYAFTGIRPVIVFKDVINQQALYLNNNNILVKGITIDGSNSVSSGVYFGLSSNTMINCL